jgi:Uma2 family endonuclease
MSFAAFKALNLPEDSSLSLLNGIVFDESDSDRDEAMTKRNRLHAKVESRLSFLLHTWRDRVGSAFGIFSGEVGCEAPDRALDVGIDVAVFSAETLSMQGDSPYIQGLPLLAVEILSPGDKQSAINDKVSGYLNAGVPLVWVIDPTFRTVVVHRPATTPQMFAGDSKLTGHDVLPGFDILTSEIFK